MVAAAVAAGVAVAATAASTALSATQGGPDLPGFEGASGLENRLRKRHRNTLFDADTYARRGAFERTLVTPDLYRQAGYEVEYDEASMAAAQAARSRADATLADLASAESELAGLRGKKARREALSGLRGKDRKAALKELRQTKKGLRRDVRSGRRQSDMDVRAAGEAEAGAGRIKSLKYVGVGSEADREIDRLLTERVKGALTTGESTDPRLLREMDEEEGLLRATLARRFGNDYENTTGGRAQLAAFNQRKKESLADFARRDVAEYNPMRLGQRQTLGAIAAQNMGLMTAPSDVSFNTSDNLQRLAGSYGAFEEMLQTDRLAALGQENRRAAANYAADQQRTQAISSSLGQLASGASGYGMMLASNARSTPGVRTSSFWGDTLPASQAGPTRPPIWAR